MIVAIGDSLSVLASSNNGEDGEDEDDEETEKGQLSEDDEPGWVKGTITQTGQQRREKFQQKEMKLDKLTQPGWEEAGEFLCESNKKSSSSELRVLAVGQPQMDDDASAPAPTTFVDLMEWLDIVPGLSQMPQGTSWPGSCHMRPGCGKLQSNSSIPGLAPTAQPDSSLIASAKTEFPSLKLYSLLYPQTQKKEIEVLLKFGIAVLFESVLWVSTMLFSSVTASVPTFANVTTRTWRMVHISFGNRKHHLSGYTYLANFDLSSRWW